MFKALLFGIVLGGLLVAAEEVTPLVMGEYSKIQSEFQVALSQSKKSIRDYENEKKRVTTASQTLSKDEMAGIEALKRYDVLLQGRYSNEQGVYQSGMEMAKADVENLNQIFQKLMRHTPFVGRTSAGHGRRTIEWGVRRLEDLAKQHSDPSDRNHPELEILAQQLKDAETKITTVTELAGRLGVKLNENLAEAPVESDRRPASRQ